MSRKENGRGKSRGLRAIRPAVQAKQQSLTATEESIPSALPRERQSRLPEQEKTIAPYAFLQIDEPKLYDFPRYNECLMTR